MQSRAVRHSPEFHFRGQNTVETEAHSKHNLVVLRLLNFNFVSNAAPLSLT